MPAIRSSNQVKTNDAKNGSPSKSLSFLYAGRVVLVILCLWTTTHQIYAAQLMYRYPSPESYDIAKPGEGVTDFEMTCCFFIALFNVVGLYAAWRNHHKFYKQYMYVGFVLAALLVLPILCGGEIKSSYKALTDRIRLMNRDIGFWQLDMLMTKSPLTSDSDIGIADKFQKLGCCGITNASQWTDGLKTKQSPTFFGKEYDLYPESCCDPDEFMVCFGNLCACDPYTDGCLQLAFNALQDYFLQRYATMGDLLFISLVSYACSRLALRVARKQTGSNASQI